MAECKNCPPYSSNCTGGWTTSAFSFGATLALLYLASALIAFFFPSLYAYLGFALSRGSIPVSVGDFTGMNVLSGLVAWFLLGIIIKAVHFAVIARSKNNSGK